MLSDVPVVGNVEIAGELEKTECDAGRHAVMSGRMVNGCLIEVKRKQREDGQLEVGSQSRGVA